MRWILQLSKSPKSAARSWCFWCHEVIIGVLKQELFRGSSFDCLCSTDRKWAPSTALGWHVAKRCCAEGQAPPLAKPQIPRSSDPVLFWWNSRPLAFEVVLRLVNANIPISVHQLGNWSCPLQTFQHHTFFPANGVFFAQVWVLPKMVCCFLLQADQTIYVDFWCWNFDRFHRDFCQSKARNFLANNSKKWDLHQINPFQINCNFTVFQRYPSKINSALPIFCNHLEDSLLRKTQRGGPRRPCCWTSASAPKPPRRRCRVFRSPRCTNNMT